MTSVTSTTPPTAPPAITPAEVLVEEDPEGSVAVDEMEGEWRVVVGGVMPLSDEGAKDSGSSRKVPP